MPNVVIEIGKTMKERTLKVREGHRDYTLKNSSNKERQPNHTIFTAGSWLEKAGFTINMPVSVTVHKNCLLLVPKEQS